MNLPLVPMPLNPFSALPGRAVLASDELDRLLAELGQTKTALQAADCLLYTSDAADE